MTNILASIYIFAATKGPAGLDPGALPNTGNDDPAAGAVQTILQIVFGISGAIALLIIVISGLRYVLSTGDPGKMSQAKNAIVYALVGLAIALSGFSIVTFVVKGLG